MKNIYIKLLFTGIVLVLVAVSLLTYRNLNNYTEEVRNVRHSSQVFLALDRVFTTIKDAETGHRGFQLTGDTAYLDPYKNSVAVTPMYLTTLDSLLAKDSVQSHRVDTLHTLIDGQFAIIEKILKPDDKGAEVKRVESGLLLEGRNNMNHIRALVKRISQREESVMQRRIASETDFRNIAPFALLVYGLVALAGISILFARVLDALQKRNEAESKLRDNIQALRSEVGIREFTQKTLRSVLDNSPDGIMAFRSLRNKQRAVVDFECILANTISHQIASVPSHNPVGKRLGEVLLDTRAASLYDTFCEVVESGKSLQREDYYPSVQKWFHITAVRLEDGVVVTFSDITRQRSQRILLEERELLLNDAEQQARMGSWRWSRKSNELIWSNGLYAILRKSKDTYTPSWDSFLDGVCVDDRPLVEKFLHEIQSTQSGLEIEYRMDCDGATRYFSHTMRPLGSHHADSDEVLGTIVDVTAQKIHENQLKQYTAELKRSNEDLEQFAYVASHDLQEPLRKIRAFGDRLSLKFGEALGQQGADYIERMQSAAARMQTLIEDLLAFSRVSRNMGELQPIDTSALLREVVDDLEAQVRREEAVVTITDLPPLMGDPAQIKRLFQNLISNAIKFHKPDAKPVINIEGAIVKTQELNGQASHALKDAEYVRINVKDNGIGFEQQYREKIFNLFQRLNGRNEFEGTGIGLSICRKIVMNHKGIIYAHSEENVGSEFTVILPLA